MTPPITPPTDNMYKFMALSGVALVIVGIYCWVQLWISFNEREQTLNESIARSLALSSANAHLSRIQWLLKNPQARREINSTQATTSPWVAEWDRAFEGLSSWKPELPPPNFDVQLSQLQTARWRLSAWPGISSICLLPAGIALAAWGFRLWYRRVQVYQDAILKAEARAKQQAEKEPAHA